MNTADIILEKYQIRKSSKQKTAFIDFVKEYSKENGYECRLERVPFGARNIIVGDTGKASVVYTAHYDTCSRLPFPNFITPKKFSIYLFYQLIITFAMVAVGVLTGILIS